MQPGRQAPVAALRRRRNLFSSAADPEIVMGQGRALFRLTDLTELARLVAGIAARRQGAL